VQILVENKEFAKRHHEFCFQHPAHVRSCFTNKKCPKCLITIDMDFDDFALHITDCYGNKNCIPAQGLLCAKIFNGYFIFNFASFRQVLEEVKT
jgi:hypothetical protein